MKGWNEATRLLLAVLWAATACAVAAQTCGGGQFVNGTSCQPCPKGRYMDADNHSRTSCFHCPLGRYQGNVNQIDCNDCPAGFYAMQSGLHECQRCPLATISSSSGQPTCWRCTTNTLPNHNQTGCSPCPEGFEVFSVDTPAELGCTPCRAGYLTLKQGITCTACPLGHFSGPAAGGSQCLPCKEVSTKA